MRNVRILLFSAGMIALVSLPVANQRFTQSAASLAAGIHPVTASVTMQAQESLITNGSFEASFINPGLYSTHGPGDTLISGWVVLPTTIDYIGTFWTSSAGARSLDLDGNFGNAGGIQQLFRTIPGERYTVTFDMAGHPEAGPTIKTLRVSADGQEVTFTFDVTGKSRANMGWVEKTWSFTADDTTATLQFVSLSGTGWGPALDNVRVTGTEAPTICIPPLSGLVSWWRGEGNARDFVGNNHGTASGGASYAPGIVGQAFKFDGVDDVITVPHSDSLNFPSRSSFTLEAWAFRTIAATVQHLVGKRAGCGGDSNFYQMVIDHRFTVVPVPPLNEWTHLVSVHEKETGQLKQYMNGMLVSSYSFVNGVNTSPFTIGNVGTCAGFAGLMDEVAVYNRSLTEAEIRSLYAAGKAGKCAAATVSAASFRSPPLAVESIATNFGPSLATSTQSAISLPLPTSLAGTTVMVTDWKGNKFPAPLFYVSPTQINFLLPAGPILGMAGVTITSSDGTVTYGAAQLETVAPGIFTANQDGAGAPAGFAIRVSGNTQSRESLYKLDMATGRQVPAEIVFGPESEAIILELYGTGIRGRSTQSAVSATIGGMAAVIEYADRHPVYVGLDQVNVRVPRALIGRGEVDVELTVDGKAANAAKIAIK